MLASTSFIWNVWPVNTADTITLTNPGDQHNTDGDSIGLSLASQPAESSLGSPLQFSTTGLPHWLSLDPSSGLISGTINGGNYTKSRRSK